MHSLFIICFLLCVREISRAWSRKRARVDFCTRYENAGVNLWKYLSVDGAYREFKIQNTTFLIVPNDETFWFKYDCDYAERVSQCHFVGKWDSRRHFTKSLWKRRSGENKSSKCRWSRLFGITKGLGYHYSKQLRRVRRWQNLRFLGWMSS